MSWKNRGPMYCRTCEANEIKTEIYFDNQHKSPSGKAIPLEKSNGQPHQCPYSKYAMEKDKQQTFKTTSPYQQDNIEGRPDTYPRQQQPPNQNQQQEPKRHLLDNPQQESNFDDHIELAIRDLNTKVEQIFGVVNEYFNNPTAAENRFLKQTIVELEEVIKKQGLSFQPANQVSGEYQTTQGFPRDRTEIEPEAQAAEAENEHVRRVMRKGQDDEELEL